MRRPCEPYELPERIPEPDEYAKPDDGYWEKYVEV